MANRVREISGKITLSDGTESEFSITGIGFQQWGATTDRLYLTSPVLDAIVEAMGEGDFMADYYADDDEEH